MIIGEYDHMIYRDHMICDDIRYWSNNQLIPLIVHLSFLLLFAVTSMHVQVSVTIVMDNINKCVCTVSINSLYHCMIIPSLVTSTLMPSVYHPSLLWSFIVYCSDSTTCS